MYTSLEHNASITDNIRKLCAEPYVVSDNEKDIRAYVLEKTLRISSATLALAGLLDSHAPLRATLERTSVGLVESAAQCVSARTARTALLSSLRALAALFESATLAGILAPSNTSILLDEITSFVTLLTDTGWAQGRYVLDEQMLGVALPESAFTDSPSRSQTFKGHTSIPTGTISDVMHPSTQRGPTGTQKDTVTNGTQHHRDKVQDIQKDRRATILSVIQRKDRITVRDVAAVIKDCSEKTLQRELLALVGQGVLVKEGERRWSTYRLA